MHSSLVRGGLNARSLTDYTKGRLLEGKGGDSLKGSDSRRICMIQKVQIDMPITSLSDPKQEGRHIPPGSNQILAAPAWDGITS